MMSTENPSKGIEHTVNTTTGTIPTPLDHKNIPSELQARRQWVIWRAETRAGGSKPTKVPYCARFPDQRASTTDPDTWASFDEALMMSILHRDIGIGYVFSESDPYVGIDVDDPEKVEDITGMFWTYAEESFSGRGVHIIALGKLPSTGINSKDGVEIYDRGRYFVFTGKKLDGFPSAIRREQEAIDELVGEYGKPKMAGRLGGLPEGNYDDSDRLRTKFLTLLTHLRPAVEGDYGDNWTYASAGKGKDLGLSPQATLECMTVEGGWNDKCIPPWEEDELMGKIASVYRNGKNDPGCDHPDVVFKAESTVPEVEGPADAEPEAVDMHSMLQATGCVGDVYEYMLKMARYPQPSFAMAAAAVTVSTVMGRKYCTIDGTYGNIYAISIGPSGCGKEEPRGGIKNCLKGLGLLGSRFMGESMASGAGIEDALTNHPVGILVLDEIGKALEDMRKGKDDHGIIKTLLALYTSSGSAYRGRPRAGTTPVIIENPYLSLYGTATPESFHRALTGADAENGWIGRLLVFTAESARPYYQEPQSELPVPDSLARLRGLALALAEFVPVNSADPENQCDTPAPPVRVRYSAEVQQLKAEFIQRNDAWLRENKGSKARAPRVRMAETAVRMSLIHAVGRNPISPEIQREDWDWGMAMAEFSTATLEKEVMPNVTSSETEDKINKLLKVIRNARSYKGKEFVKATEQGYMPRRCLTQKMREMKPDERDRLLASLVEEGSVAFQKGCDGYNGQVYYIPKEC